MLLVIYTSINLEKNKRTIMLNYIVHSLIPEFEKIRLRCCHLKTTVRDVAYKVNVTIIMSRVLLSFSCSHPLIHLIEASSYASFLFFDVTDGK